MSQLLIFFSSLSQAYGWLILVGVILFIAVILHVMIYSIYAHLLPRLHKTHKIWDDTLLIAAYAPFMLFVWLFAFSLLIPTIVNHLTVDSSLFHYFPRIRQLLFIVALIWFSLRYVTQVEYAAVDRISHIKHKKMQDRTTIRAVSQLSRVIVIIVGILVAMQTLGISISTLLAVGGVGGIAIGFAAKDTIANFIGGMMIFWDRPFSVGDWVRSPDRQIEGTVEHIGWRLTRILTFDKRPLYVPNGIISTISVENPSRMTNRRIKTTIGLRYNDATKVAVILKDVETMLRQHPEIDTNQTLMVNLFEFGPSSLNFFIYTFTKTTEWIKFQAIQQDVFLKAIDIITQHGAECAFPTTTLHVPEGVLVKQEEQAS